MITGRVENRQALIPITYRLPGQPVFVLEHVVDTGFTGELTLPASVVAAMGLQRVPVYLATIVWEGQEFIARVYATGRRPLFGTFLMARKELLIQFHNNGLMTLDDF